jgi:hypothetical protein
MLQRSGLTLIAVVLALNACSSQAQQSKANPTSTTNPDALVLQDFKQRVDKYLELHKQLAKKTPRQKETNDPAEIKAAQQVLAETIQVARKDAKPGDIFTSEIRAKFRQLMHPELKGSDGRETKEIIKEDGPVAVPLKVNAHYPENAPLPTVPPNILARLPQLPEQLDYRIVDKHLILRDTVANIIVDFIPNAIR